MDASKEKWILKALMLPILDEGQVGGRRSGATPPLSTFFTTHTMRQPRFGYNHLIKKYKHFLAWNVPTRLSTIPGKQGYYLMRKTVFTSWVRMMCSGPMKPDTNLSGIVATIEQVSDGQKAAFVQFGVQAGRGKPVFPAELQISSKGKLSVSIAL